MIFDAHMHLGNLPNYYLPERGVDSVLSLMDHCGIDYGMQMHMSGFFQMKNYAYDISKEIFEASGGRIYFGLIFDPNEPVESLKWIKKSISHPGCVCVKIHPSWHRKFAGDAGYDPLWKFALENDVPIVSHTWAVSGYNPTQKFSTPEHFLPYLEKYPEARLVMGHGGGRYSGLLKAIEICKEFPNVCIDTSGDINAFGLLKYQVEEIGADRILFGSDVNMIDSRGTIGKILASNISKEERTAILWENALHVFHLDLDV